MKINSKINMFFTQFDVFLASFTFFLLIKYQITPIIPPNVKLIDKKQTINSNKGKMDRKYFKKKGKIIEKNNMSL